jgi:uncharacterized RDD family membrane protein YckC
MSEVSQGPGWWLASDGKWYPAHLHPSLGPPPPPPPAAAFGGSATAGPAPAQVPRETWGAPNSETYGAAPTWSGYQDSSTVDPVLGLRLAPWWKRLVAIIIDNIILGLGLFLLLLVLGIAANASHTHSSSTSSHGAVVLAGLLVLWLIASIPAGLYFAIMNGSRRGQTVGKLALSIAVRDARTGAPVGFWRALGRFLITLVFALLFYLPYLIDSLAPLWDKRRQAWHDKVAHSVVVDLKP